MEEYPLVLKCEKVIFTDPKFVEADGAFPAKWQVEVKAGTASFIMESRSIDLTKVPIMEPCKLEAIVAKFTGGKGYHVVLISQFSAASLLPGGQGFSSKPKEK